MAIRITAPLAGVLLALAAATAAHAQSAKKYDDDIVPVKKLDDEIFTRFNQAQLCRPDGDKRYVDKTELARMFLARDQRYGAAFSAWFLSSNNKLYKPLPQGQLPSLVDFLDTQDKVLKIQCMPPRSPDQEPTSFKEAVEKATKNVVVRKAVSDLVIPADKITKANGALLSYAKDGVGNTTTFSVEGLIGYVISGTAADTDAGAGRPGGAPLPRDLFWYSVTPYIFLKRFDLEPDSASRKDVNYYTPGASANWSWLAANNRVGLDAQLDLAATIDNEYSSQVESATFRFLPRLYWGMGLPELGSIYPLGPFLLRPDLALVLRQYHISDAGDNPELVGRSSYSSAGFDATAQLYWGWDTPIFSSFVLKGAYIFRENSGDVPDVIRRTATLSFSPAFSKNFSIELEYAQGRDEVTLKPEERWTLGLAIRY